MAGDCCPSQMTSGGHLVQAHSQKLPFRSGAGCLSLRVGLGCDVALAPSFTFSYAAHEGVSELHKGIARQILQVLVGDSLTSS